MTSAPLTLTTLPGRVRRELERLVRAAQHDWKSPGVSAGVVLDGRPLWSAHVGSARVDPPRQATDDTAYMIGSITKTFTALLVMSLRDRGVLRLDDPLSAFLPQTRHGSLTIRQLLSHASGLQREPVGRIWESLRAPDDAQLVAELEQAEQVLPAHTAFHYSNLAYALLGQVVRQLEGRSWEETLIERILLPLEMRHTGLLPNEKTRALGYLVHPHARTASVEPRFELHATAPLGGLWSTVTDMGRYAAFVANPVAEVLSPDTVEEMCQPVVMTDLDGWSRAHGIGFDLARRGDRVLVGHGGAMPGFLAGLRVRRRERVGAVAFANSTAGSDPVLLAAQLVEAVLDAVPALAPVWRPSSPQAAFDGILGSWWSEGEELVFEVREDQLWCRAAGLAVASTETRFEAAGPDLFRAVEGRERGELLEIVRADAVADADADADGGDAVSRMYFATYALTKEPTAFADLT